MPVGDLKKLIPVGLLRHACDVTATLVDIQLGSLLLQVC